MRINWTRLIPGVVLAFALGAEHARAAAPATPQGFITGQGYYGIPGTAVTALTGHPKFPDVPDYIFLLPYFEWNATGDLFTAPGEFANNYGGQISGYFYPPSTGDYTFYIAADDNAVLYLSTDADPANKKLIAQETAWSTARQYFESGGNSDLLAKDSSQFAGTEWPTKSTFLPGAQITLQQGQPYYIEALFKEGGGGDYLSVFALDPGFTLPYGYPIPGERLSSARTVGPVTVTRQPADKTVDERGSVTFDLLVDGTPPYTIQWRKDGVDIPDATNLTYTVTGATMADDGAAFSAFVTGAEGTATSADAILTIAPDTVLPTALEAKATPDRTGVVVTFSEPMDQTTAETIGNYVINSPTGPLNVTGATLSGSGTVVTLTTDQQTLGTKYTLLISGVQDTAATPNAITPNSKVVFFPTGRIIEQNGMIVFEAENFDRNLDGLWIKNTTRGNPSGGVSMVEPNGAPDGGENSTKLEYDVEFAQAATYQVWYRASGDSGSDDSAWFHLDGARPPERAANTDAAMTGFSGALDFVWDSDSFNGPDPFTVVIPSAGIHVIGVAVRENGSFFDKFILTTVPGFTPSGFGPPETREGAPGLPTATITGPTDGATFSLGDPINIAVDAAGQSTLEITRVEFTANGEVIGESTTSPFSFTWTDAPAGIYAIRATAFDEIGQSTTSDSAVVTVGTPPPQILFVVGTASDPILNASDAAIQARLESFGWQVWVVQAPPSTTADADGKQLIVLSSTVNSGDVGTKFANSAVPVITWEQALQDEFQMSLTGNGNLAAQTQGDIVDSTHPMAAGLAAGTVTLTTAAQDYSYGGSPAATAEVVATATGNPAQAIIYGYDAGALLADGVTPAPARRAMFFFGNNGYDAATPEAKALFDAAIFWASELEPVAKARIAWVSFHAADDTPSAAATTAGFTEAPDVGYTELLRANGYEVTRFVRQSDQTPTSPLIDQLNTFDLVIISRSVPSGDFDNNATETKAWNEAITVPMMILGGYINRDNRLGFHTANNIPDTAGPIRLTVNDPSHPIFQGVALDAGNTMANVYADLVTFTNRTQRGISVVTDPIVAGGTVLATVGTAGDPATGGMIIGEFPAGTAVNGGADTLGGHRLIFLTGSREAGTVGSEPGLTAEGSGIFDLEQDGIQLFLNAVEYMVEGPGGGGDGPTISITRNGNQVSIDFTGSALEAADSVTGTWSEVATSSPYQVTADQPMRFYRARE